MVIFGNFEEIELYGKAREDQKDQGAQKRYDFGFLKITKNAPRIPKNENFKKKTDFIMF